MRWILVFWSSACMAGDFALISVPAAETTGYPGSPLLLSVTGRSESGQEISYQWKKNGKPLKGETGHVFIIKKAAAKDAGTYSVDVKSGDETKSAQTVVTMSKTKLKAKARVPAQEMPATPSCHDSGGGASAPAEHHDHH